MPEGKLVSALRDLCRMEIEFILVGGLAAVLNGAPIVTYDLDLVFATGEPNLSKILQFFQDSDAIFRLQPERRLRPGLSHLLAKGHLNLNTRFGAIDFLGSIGAGMEFDQLLSHSRKVPVGEGFEARVLDLETIIAVKESIGSLKDRAVLPTLYETLKESRKR